MTETRRLILREMDDNDFDSLYAVLADRDIMCHYRYVFDEERVRSWISTNKERYRVFGFGLWAVCLKDTGEVIGDCGLTMQVIDGFIRPEIGYHIRADKQRQGYAREAACAVRDWAFANTPFRVLYSYMHTANLPSSATARSAGMTHCGTYTDEDGTGVSVYSVSKPY